MITLEHIKTLSASELRIIAYMTLTGNTLVSNQLDLADELKMTTRSVGTALRSLEERGIISYDRKQAYGAKGTIILH